jgi:ectoine hydroxylase
MKLTPSQISEFEERGYLFYPELFTPGETALLTGELGGIFATTRQ